MVKKTSQIATPEYEGEERRAYSHTCFDHGRHEERMANHGKRITDIEDRNPIGMPVFKWAIGSVLFVTLTLFTIPLYMFYDTSDTLVEIKVRQERTIAKLEEVTEDLREIKQLNRTEIDKIHRKMNEALSEFVENHKYPHP